MLLHLALGFHKGQFCLQFFSTSTTCWVWLSGDTGFSAINIHMTPSSVSIYRQIPGRQWKHWTIFLRGPCNGWRQINGNRILTRQRFSWLDLVMGSSTTPMLAEVALTLKAHAHSLGDLLDSGLLLDGQVTVLITSFGCFFLKKDVATITHALVMPRLDTVKCSVWGCPWRLLKNYNWSRTL